jgi:hypothetical protein
VATPPPHPPLSSLLLSTLALTPARRRSFAVRASLLGALAALTPFTGCRDAGIALGGAGVGAKARAEEAFEGLAERYVNVHQGPKFDYARVHLADAALVPSRVFEDTAVWTSHPNATTRILGIGEHVTPAGINESEAALEVPWPSHMGDARHSIVLSRLAKSEYAWDTDVAFAIGSVRAEDVGNAFEAIFSAAEGRTESQLRDDYRIAFPRTAAVLGELFSIDTLRPLALADGSTLLTLCVGLHPEGLQAHYPVFWDYVNRYVRSTRYHYTVGDPAGAQYFDIVSNGPMMTIRLRTLKGRMVPLSSSLRPLPDTLVLSGSFVTHIKMFTVGASSFASEFIISREPHERAWTFNFRKEPDWQLPMATSHLLRKPLRRPFEGNGVQFRVSVRDSLGAETVFNRRLHAEVKESAIMHWAGGLISKVAADLGGQSEKEQFAWLGAAFEAMKMDVGGLWGEEPKKKPEDGSR